MNVTVACVYVCMYVCNLQSFYKQAHVLQFPSLKTYKHVTI